MGEHALADEAVVIGDVTHCDAQQIIPLPRHGVAFDDLLAPFDESFEVRAGVHGLAAHPNLAENVDGAAETGWIGETDRGAEHALLLQIAHPAPDRGGRGANALRKRGMAEARVALKRANDSAVNLVEMMIFAHECGLPRNVCFTKAQSRAKIDKPLRAPPARNRPNLPEALNGTGFHGERQADTVREARRAEFRSA